MKALELFLSSVVCLGLAVTPGWAGDDAMHRFGRVSALVGAAQYKSPAGEWSDALVNEPVATGTGLRTVRGAEAEMRNPGARVVLAPSSELHVLRSDDDLLQIAVAVGRIGVHLDNSGAAQTVEVDLPHGGIWLSAPGDYDIAAGDAHTPATVQVFDGNARLGGGLDDKYIASAAPDSFSDWWRSQDSNSATPDRGQLADIAGVLALDAAGRWETDPNLGKIWYPSDIAADWTPYRDGAWRFLPPWGWTWVDNASWGFGPSHYGRWARINDRWGWVPGPLLAPTDYSPATVAFLGTAGIGLSRPAEAGPAVDWFPLAPGETVGDGNDANYQNRAFATAVPRATFAGGFPVANAVVDDLPERRFADAPVILQALGIAPSAATVTAATPKKPPPVFVATISAPTPEPHPKGRPPFIVALRDVPPRAPVHDLHKKLRIAAAIVVRPHPLASALHSPHNRAHLAAIRGGA
jgi:hypothetical protein